MKFFAFILSLSLISNTWAQSIDGSDSLDSVFAETTLLTDQQADEAQSFVHQGLRDKAIQKGCDNKTLKGCDGSSAQPGLEDQIGKMYALIFGLGPMMMGGGNRGSSGGSSGASGGEAAAGASGGEGAAGNSGGRRGNGKDFCIFIPIGYEAISMMIQMGGQKQAQQDSQNLDPQLAALVNLKETHRTRKKTATFQAGIYATTAACYGAMLLMGNLSGTMTFVKMGAAGALSVLYMSKAKKHAKAASMVQEVIDSLPKAGDCNPWTGSACFCSEKTSAKLYPGQYQEVCVLNKGNFAGTKSNFGCAVQAGGSLSLDANCDCQKTQSCFSSKISLGTSALGMGANFVNDANQGLQLLDPSQFDEARLGDFQSSTAAKIGGIKAKDNVVPNVNLSPSQKRLADEMSKVAPASIAALAAASPNGGPPSGGLMSGSTASALDRLPPTLKKDLKDFAVSGQYRRSGGSSPTSAAAEPGFSIPGMGGPAQPQGGLRAADEEFAARAVSQADVRNSPDTAIFDIISNRYRSSGWRRLEAEEK